MTTIWMLGALLIPWAAGIVLVAALSGRRERSFLTVGAGWLLGQALVMAALYVSLVGLGRGHARLVLLVLALVPLVAWIIRRRKWASSPGSESGSYRGSAPIPSISSDGAEEDISSSGAPPRGFVFARRMILAVIAASLLAKLYLLICAHAFLLLRNDDAIAIWLFKAKVIVSLDQLPLDPAGDYYRGGSIPAYSPFVPLAAAWIPMVTGAWHEQLATLPWLFYYGNLILLIAGGLRRRLAPTASWIAAYVVASLPLMVVHAYRPGYADLILSAFLAGTMLYLLIWRETNRFCDLLLAAIFALAAACLKRESPMLVAIAVPAVLLPSWRNVRAWTARTRLAALIVAAAGVLIVASVVDFSEQRGALDSFGYQPGVWSRLGQHLFDWSSFHLLFWTVAATAIALSCLRRLPDRAPALLATIGLCGFHAAVFLFTSQSRFALNNQTPSRLFLQLAPSLVMVWAVALAPILNGSAEPPPQPDHLSENKEAAGG